jgi:hypothetical protein
MEETQTVGKGKPSTAINPQTPFVVFYGYHPEDEFSVGVGKRISSLNLPNIKAVRLNGIAGMKGLVVQQVDEEIKDHKERMKGCFFLDLHAGEVDVRIHPRHPKVIVVLGERLMRSTGYLQNRLRSADIDFYSTYEEGPLPVTTLEFFPNRLSGIDEGVQLLLKLVEELSRLIDWDIDVR